ncbi:uncharacterized protein DEA37_0007468 [Paragonimus westermani]|uniref:Uncharacterized protein n=1 Tax=Paragonimus westermani TaxID=34504 RepID=A0A5J4N6J7_9TREM|nr:uncharacterized protein DEA37_0007468 [Paragonimus westermani]
MSLKLIKRLRPEVDYSALINTDDDHSLDKFTETDLGYGIHANCTLGGTLPKDVLNDYREPGILTGYRSEYRSLKLCILSVFHLHNETVNIWTQIIPAAFFCTQLFFTNDPFLLIYLGTTVSFLLTSACAHTFSCYSATGRHVCFFFDYAGITLYSCGCAVCYYAYALPQDFMRPSAYLNADVCDVYLFLSVFLSIWSTHLSGTTRFWKPSFKRKCIRLCAFLIIWLYLAIPVLWRLAKCALLSGSGHYGDCVSMYYWILQFMSAVTAGLLYVSHFPERWFPGRFDLFGHSHQIFHVFGASGAYNQYRALRVDLRERSPGLLLNHSPSFPLCLLCVVIVMFANLIIFRKFYKKLNRLSAEKQL